MTAIKAHLRNYKPLVSRPYMQIILEVPEEQGKAVIATLGWPTAGKSIWVGVARLEDDATKIGGEHETL